jgi:hypothetical protein
MKAKSIKGKSPEEIRLSLEECMADGYQPTLATVFLSIQQDRKIICEILHDKGIDILGATSCGEFTNGYQDKESTVILLLDINPAYYTILFEDFHDTNLAAAATRIANKALQKFERPAFILCTTGVSKKGEFLDGEIIVRSIENIIGSQVSIYGGMAGDDWTISGTYVFTYESETDEGMAVLILDEDKISLYGMAISGWKPLGISRTVTSSKGGLIYTIDNQPALDMYLKYLGKEAVTIDDKYKAFEDIGVHYPLQIERETGEPVMRTPVAFNRKENALLCDFAVPQGSKLRFSMPPDFDIVEDVLEKANQLKTTRQADAEALLIFSCAGRYSALGPMATSENEGLSDVWKIPMAGFFTYGEYGRAINGKHEFHSTTCCWVALKENTMDKPG